MRFCYYKYAGPKDSFKSKTNFLFVECFIYYRNSRKMLKLAARCRIICEGSSKPVGPEH